MGWWLGEVTGRLHGCANKHEMSSQCCQRLSRQWSQNPYIVGSMYKSEMSSVGHQGDAHSREQGYCRCVAKFVHGWWPHVKDSQTPYVASYGLIYCLGQGRRLLWKLKGQLTYRHDTCKAIQCLRKCWKACYVKHCMCMQPVIHKCHAFYRCAVDR